MTLNGVNEAFKTGFTVKLQNRGSKSGGITFELKSIFEEMAKKGLIKDKDGKGLTKQDALNMYNALNKIHQEKGLATNYTQMEAGQEFQYSAEDLKAMAEAAGYEINNDAKTSTATEQETVPKLKLETPKPKELPEPELPEKLELPQNLAQQQLEEMVETQGGKIIEREVNGEKTKIAVVDVDGQKIRRQVNEDGTLGDTLVPISTAGKNKYITQTEMNNRIKNVFPEGVPEGVTASYVSICGEPQLVFKKDGKTLDQAQLRELVKSQQSENKMSVDNANFENEPVSDVVSQEKSEFNIDTYDYGYALKSFLHKQGVIPAGTPANKVQESLNFLGRGSIITLVNTNSTSKYSFTPEENKLTCIFKMDAEKNAYKTVYNLKTGEVTKETLTAEE